MAKPITGQAVCTGNNTAVPLSAIPVRAQAFTITAPASNAGPVWIGDSTVTSTTGYQLDPGTIFIYARNTQLAGGQYQLEPSDLYVAGPTNYIVTWFGTP